MCCVCECVCVCVCVLCVLCVWECVCCVCVCVCVNVSISMYSSVSSVVAILCQAEFMKNISKLREGEDWSFLHISFYIKEPRKFTLQQFVYLLCFLV